VSFVEQIALREHAELETVGSTATVGEVRANYETRFIEKLRAGDAVAFDSFVRERTGDIYALLLRLTQDAEEARDLTQETFLHAFRSIGSFRGDADLRTWLYRIAVNQARNRLRWWRRRRRNEIVSLDEPDPLNGISLGSRLIDETCETPEACLMRQERERHLLRALATLGRDTREVVVLRDIEGFSYEEVAETLNMSIGTVKSRLSRARAELRRRLDHL
jgi:RNA polymerase sigma-70 factor (ECF subfamily)